MAPLLFRGARVFDGESVHDECDVLVVDGKIAEVGERIEAPADAHVIDAAGHTLLPGLIDCHTHAKPPALEMALTFGVTTELDMFADPAVMTPQRREAQSRNTMADVRSAMTGASPSGGHPSGMIGVVFDNPYPVLDEAEDAEAFVAARVAEGADYLKVMIEDGTIFGHEAPRLSDETVHALVRAAHAQGLMAVAHAMTVEQALLAVRAGADGLMHGAGDRLATDAEIAEMAEAGIFVVPTLSTLASAYGDKPGQHLAEDERARPMLSDAWVENLSNCWHLDNPGSTATISSLVQASRVPGVVAARSSTSIFVRMSSSALFCPS